MGIKSSLDWSDVIVDGVTLGTPAVDEVTGEMHWDGGVPNGVVDVDGDFLLDSEDLPLVKFVTMDGVDLKLKAPKATKSEKNQDGEWVQVPNLYHKGATVFFENVLYVCNKDGVLFDAASKDWSEPKTKEV